MKNIYRIESVIIELISLKNWIFDVNQKSYLSSFKMIANELSFKKN